MFGRNGDDGGINGVKVGIVGGTGYTGVELLRLLAQHPQADLPRHHVAQEAGTAVSALFPSLRGRATLAFAHPDERGLKECDVVFFATPNGVAMGRRARWSTPACASSTSRPISASRTWPNGRRWYKVKHACPELVARGGLRPARSEPRRDPRRAAGGNPGCYPTAVQLGLLPLVEAGAVDPIT